MGFASFFSRGTPEPQKQHQPLSEKGIALLTEWFLDRRFFMANYNGELTPNSYPNKQKEDGLALIIQHRPRDPAKSLFDLEILAFDSFKKHVRFQFPENFSVGIVRIQDDVEYDFREATITSGMFNSIEIRGLEVNTLYQFKSPGLATGQPAFLKPISPTDIEIADVDFTEDFTPFREDMLSQNSMPARRSMWRRA